jgi:hypothetical protein
VEYLRALLALAEGRQSGEERRSRIS